MVCLHKNHFPSGLWEVKQQSCILNTSWWTIWNELLIFNDAYFSRYYTHQRYVCLSKLLSSCFCSRLRYVGMLLTESFWIVLVALLSSFPNQKCISSRAVVLHFLVQNFQNCQRSLVSKLAWVVVAVDNGGGCHVCDCSLTDNLPCSTKIPVNKEEQHEHGYRLGFVINDKVTDEMRPTPRSEGFKCLSVCLSSLCLATSLLVLCVVVVVPFLTALSPTEQCRVANTDTQPHKRVFIYITHPYYVVSKKCTNFKTVIAQKYKYGFWWVTFGRQIHNFAAKCHQSRCL